METLTLRRAGAPCPIDASEAAPKRILNVLGSDLVYRADPLEGTPATRLSAGESAVVRERVWVRSELQTRAVVESVR